MNRRAFIRKVAAIAAATGAAPLVAVSRFAPSIEAPEPDVGHDGGSYFYLCHGQSTLDNHLLNGPAGELGPELELAIRHMQRFRDEEGIHVWHPTDDL